MRLRNVGTRLLLGNKIYTMEKKNFTSKEGKIVWALFEL